jgi:hypothetical protein
MSTYADLPGFPAYRVSDAGVVERNVGVRYGYNDWRPVTTHPLSSGALVVNLRRNGDQTQRSVAALVLEAFGQPRPTGLYARHKNGNNQDNRLTNLFWGAGTGGRPRKQKAHA